MISVMRIHFNHLLNQRNFNFTVWNGIDSRNVYSLKLKPCGIWLYSIILTGNAFEVDAVERSNAHFELWVVDLPIFTWL